MTLERIPLMGVDVVALDAETVLRSEEIRRAHGLLVNDSLVVAAARSAGVEHLASADTDFSRVKDLKLYGPGDLK